MSAKNKKDDPFCVFYGLVNLPDPEETCAICGGDIWPGEPIGWSQKGHICHDKCAENELRLKLSTPDKPSVWDWTAREMYEYCKARVTMQGGDCLESNAKECSLYAMCCKCPDQWEE